MATTPKKEVAAIEQVKEAFNKLGYGDAKTLAYDKLSLTDKSTEAEIKKAAEDFVKDAANKPFLDGHKIIDLKKYYQDEIFKAAGDTKKIIQAEANIRVKAEELGITLETTSGGKPITLSQSIENARAGVEKYVKTNLKGTKDSALAKGTEELTKKFAVLKESQDSLNLGEKFLSDFKTAKETFEKANPGKTYVPDAPGINSATHVSGIDNHIKTITEKMTELEEAHISGMDAAAKTEYLKEIGALSEAHGHVKTVYGSLGKGLEGPVAGEIADAEKVAQKLFDLRKAKTKVEQSHVLTEARNSFENGGVDFTKNEKNVQTMFANLGNTVKSLGKGLTSGGAGFPWMPAVGGVALIGAGATVLKSNERDENGNPVVGEDGNAKKKFGFASVASTVIGAALIAYAADKHLNEGKWVEKIASTFGGKGKGI